MLFFLYGADTFRSKRKLHELKRKYLEKYPLGSGLNVFDFSDGDFLNAAMESFSNSGLFSEPKLIILNNFIKDTAADSQKKIVKLLEKTDAVNDKDKTVVFWESEEPRKNNSFFKYLLENSKKQNFALLEGIQLEKFIKEEIAAYNPRVTISPVALKALISFTGNDLSLLDNEIKKLANFKEEDEITEQDVSLLVKAKVDANIFGTIESIFGNNKKTALKLFYDQLEHGEDPFYILSMYVYQMRIILKIKGCLESGVFSPYDIAKTTALHPYVVQKNLPKTREMSLDKIREIYRMLSDIDLQTKTGKADIVSSLTQFIASI